MKRLTKGGGGKLLSRTFKAEPVGFAAHGFMPNPVSFLLADCDWLAAIMPIPCFLIVS